MIGIPIGDTKGLQLSLRQRIYAARPPVLSDGQLAVLREMASDLSVREWAERWGCTRLELERAAYWLGVELGR